MNHSFPNISVVIPVKNEAGKIRECIEGILSQSIPVMEIIVVDSGSTDGTIEILQDYDIVKLVQIPSDQFNHGETRNLGVSHTSGEFVILTVGDAKPYDIDWIKNLLAGFDDNRVAGVCGMQVVAHHKNNNPVEWFRPIDNTTAIIKHAYSKGQFESLTPLEKKIACSWDDVTAMYRRSALMEIPFRRTSYCEDAIWAQDALLAGYTLAYNPAARVYHYHFENKDFTFKRTLTTLYFRYKHFGFIGSIPRKSIVDNLRIVKTIWKSFPFKFKENIFWYKYNVDQFNAMRDAHTVFHNAIEKGDHVLNEEHEKFCGKPPIPLKNANVLTS